MTRAVCFDFNGTLSHDEPILCEIFVELFAEHGKPLSAQEYFDQLAGLSDPEIVRTWLGPDHPDVDEVIDERVARYRGRRRGRLDGARERPRRGAPRSGAGAGRRRHRAPRAPRSSPCSRRPGLPARSARS